MKKFFAPALIAAVFFVASIYSANSYAGCFGCIDIGPVHAGPSGVSVGNTPVLPGPTAPILIPPTPPAPPPVQKVIDAGKNAANQVNTATANAAQQAANQTNKVISQAGTDIGNGWEATKKGVGHLAEEAKKQLPNYARFEACMETVCYSEIRLQQKIKEQKEKDQQELDELNAELAKATAQERQKLVKERIAVLKDLEKKNAEDMEATKNLLNYDNTISAFAKGEVSRRNDLKKAGTDYKAFVNEQSVAVQGMIKLINDNSTQIASNGVSADFWSKLANAQVSTKLAGEDLIAQVMAGLDTQILDRISENADLAAKSTQGDLNTLTQLDNDTKAKIAGYQGA